MITLNEKLQNIRNKLSDFLNSQSQSSKICAFRVSHIPTQIENVDVGINKIPLYAVDSVPYVITENELRGLTEISRWMFYHCKSLKSIEIPDSVISIGTMAFYNCTSLTSITIPDSVTNIGGSAFENCTSLTSITIPDSVTSIGDGAFAGCSALESIIIPNSVTWIGGNAFSYCTSLANATIRGNITTISYNLFYGCSNLANIYIHSATPPALSYTYAIPDHTTIHVPVGSGDAYRNATNWSYHSARIVENSAL